MSLSFDNCVSFFPSIGQWNEFMAVRKCKVGISHIRLWKDNFHICVFHQSGPNVGVHMLKCSWILMSSSSWFLNDPFLKLSFHKDWMDWLRSFASWTLKYVSVIQHQTSRQKKAQLCMIWPLQQISAIRDLSLSVNPLFSLCFFIGRAVVCYFHH